MGSSAEATLLRRNHAYFWYPVSNRPERPVAFRIDSDRATAVLELNSVEGGHGNEDASVIREQARGEAEVAALWHSRPRLCHAPLYPKTSEVFEDSEV